MLFDASDPATATLLSPATAAEIAGPGGDDWQAVALFTAALCVPPTLAALSARETHEVPTELLGERAGRSESHPETVSA